MHAACMGGSLQCLKLLLDYGGNTNIRSLLGELPEDVVDRQKDGFDNLLAVLQGSKLPVLIIFHNFYHTQLFIISAYMCFTLQKTSNALNPFRSPPANLKGLGGSPPARCKSYQIKLHKRLSSNLYIAICAIPIIRNMVIANILIFCII